MTFVVEILRNPKIALHYWLVGGRVLGRGLGVAKLFPLLSVFRLQNKNMLIKEYGHMLSVYNIE